MSWRRYIYEQRTPKLHNGLIVKKSSTGEVVAVEEKVTEEMLLNLCFAPCEQYEEKKIWKKIIKMGKK